MENPVTIILISFNTVHKTRQCLDLLIKLTNVPFHIWIVDNASTDGSRNMLREYQQLNPSILSVIENEKNFGYAPAVNQVYPHLDAISDLCYVNSDVYVGPQWIMRLQHHLTHDSQIAAVAPIGRGIGGRQDMISYQLPQSNFAYSEIALAEVNSHLAQITPCAMTTKNLQGTLLYVRRAAHDHIGGLDPGCAYGADDADWCLRARLAGWKLTLALDTFVWHDNHSSFHLLSDLGKSRIDRSWAHFNHKWTGHFEGMTWTDLMENQVPTARPFYQHEEF